MNMKICNRCKLEKPFEDFCMNNNAKDGFNYMCRSCVKEWRDGRKEYYRNNRRRVIKKKRISNQSVEHISFKNINFDRDFPETLKLLQLLNYDITQDIHLQFNQRVLMRSGKVLEYKPRPKDRLSKYFE